MVPVVCGRWTAWAVESMLRGSALAIGFAMLVKCASGQCWKPRGPGKIGNVGGEFWSVAWVVGFYWWRGWQVFVGGEFCNVKRRCGAVVNTVPCLQTLSELFLNLYQEYFWYLKTCQFGKACVCVCVIPTECNSVKIREFLAEITDSSRMSWQLFLPLKLLTGYLCDNYFGNIISRFVLLKWQCLRKRVEGNHRRWGMNWQNMSSRGKMSLDVIIGFH